jgi:hypothetical protein
MSHASRLGLAAAALAALVAGTGGARAQEIQVSGSVDDVNVYVAEEGDNLWDIAERFFNDPWYWPTLWSFNPHITNPNWIFPGDLVYLVPPKPVPKEQEGYTITQSRYNPRPQGEAALGRRVGFITPEDYEGAGVIEKAREERQMLAETDEVYVRFSTAKRVKAGDLFLIYRVEQELEHPVTDETLGYRVRYLGTAKVASTETALVKAVFVETFEEVRRGDRVGPYAPIQRLVPPVKNAVALAATVINAFDDRVMIGEYHYVLIDRGSNDGVAIGNRFLVRDRGDGIEDENPDPEERQDFPIETYAEILVIDVRETTSLGIVTYANREFKVGASCDMLAGY